MLGGGDSGGKERWSRGSGWEFAEWKGGGARLAREILRGSPWDVPEENRKLFGEGEYRYQISSPSKVEAFSSEL
jgi:hypothetical protein